MAIAEYHIGPVTRSAINYLVRNVTEMDRKEMWYAYGLKPEDAIPYSLLSTSRVAAVYIEGSEHPAMVFGLGKATLFDKGSRCIWGLQTDIMAGYKKSFVRASKDVLEQLPSGLILWNNVWAGNKQTLRWLEQIGFTISEARPHGWLGKPFHFVERVI